MAVLGVSREGCRVMSERLAMMVNRLEAVRDRNNTDVAIELIIILLLTLAPFVICPLVAWSGDLVSSDLSPH